jgi:hypothetical protein
LSHNENNRCEALRRDAKPLQVMGGTQQTGVACWMQSNFSRRWLRKRGFTGLATA